jgi:hypothetical protein
MDVRPRFPACGCAQQQQIDLNFQMYHERECFRRFGRVSMNAVKLKYALKVQYSLFYEGG